MTKEKFIELAYKVSAGIANAVLVTLGIGLLLQSIGELSGIDPLVKVGAVTKLMLAPAFGVGVAYQLGGNTLVIFSAMAASTIGGNALQQTADGAFALTTGQPISAVLAGLIAAIVGNFVTGKTKLDMMSIPLAAVFVGGLAGVGLAAVTTPLLEWISRQITSSVQGSPLFGPMIVSLVFSILLMSPASSAALAIALQLDPVSSAAALIGCTVQFVGFTAMSFRQNEIGANIAQSVITPKVQFPNVVKNPRIVIPPFVASMICAPIATLLFHFQTSYELAGIGLNSLIAPISILSNQGLNNFLVYIAVGIVLPMVVCPVIYQVIKKVGWSNVGDLKMEVQ